MSSKQYLGDSVYADCDGHYIILTTDNGAGPSNTIYMEPSVVQAFFKFYETIITEESCNSTKQ